MLQWLSEKLFPNDGDGNTHHTPVRPEVGAAALMVEAAHRDGKYTEVEKDLATSAAMKLFNLNKMEAVELIKEAWAAQKVAPYMMRFAMAAKELGPDQREQLVTRLWWIIDSDRVDTINESLLIHSVIDILGISRERAKALRLPVPKEGV